ncbi:MAG TPA: two-component regulator propeller domain-containing protein, partial [Pyrinomonadaceae bacterium]|nr:two-component regulator propeller domain-containing protein [Pyrinomonadaceae bacterium]
ASETQIYLLKLNSVSRYLQNLYEDKNSGLWIGDIGKIYYLQNGKIAEYSQKEGFPTNTRAHDFWEETDGSIWFATGDGNLSGVGLMRFKDEKFDKFGLENGLSNDRIFYVYKDRESNIWLATDKGLNRLRKQIVTPISTKDGLIYNESYPILKARDGSIYIGTVEGLSRFSGGNFTNTTFSCKSATQSKASIQSLWEDETGKIWIGMVGCFGVLENGKIREVDAFSDRPRAYFAIRSDRNGNLWIATEHDGVYQFRDGKIIANLTTENGLINNDVKFIHEDKKGDLWFGTFGGLSHLKDGRFTNFTVKEGLASDLVRSIYEDADGIFWIGTYDGGLSRFKDGIFFNFNETNGLFNNGVFAIAEDGRGNFWMSSNKGIYRVSKQQLNDFADGKINHFESFAYGKSDGMLTTECNGGRQPSVMKNSDGKIWFPTLEGIAVVDPEKLETNPLPPPVEIENVAIDRENISLKNDSKITLSPSQNYLDIEFTALSFIKSDQIKFRYKLEGLDKDWIDAGTRRSVNYSYLPPGEYVFRVIAANTDGVWNTEGKSIKIEVLAPFYKTFRFWFAFALVLLGVFYMVYRLRIKQLQKLNAAQEAFSRQLIESQEAERKRIAQELHDGLGQNLLVIKNRALLGLAAKENPEKADEQFSEIQESVTDALAEVRTIAYNLRPLHIERLGLTSTIEEMIEDVEKASGIEIIFDIENIDGIFSKDNEINVYRIIQECLSNIVKHSEAKKASVTIFRENQNIVLTVKDDGKGFDPVKGNEKKGLGLNGISERVKILGGNFSIESEFEKGTTFLVEIKIES